MGEARGRARSSRTSEAEVAAAAPEAAEARARDVGGGRGRRPRRPRGGAALRSSPRSAAPEPETMVEAVRGSCWRPKHSWTRNSSSDDEEGGAAGRRQEGARQEGQEGHEEARARLRRGPWARSSRGGSASPAATAGAIRGVLGLDDVPRERREPKGPRPKHVPQRTCVVCRSERGKRELVRIVRTPAGAVQVDPTGKVAGRGAYLCKARLCWQGPALAQQAECRAEDDDRQRKTWQR